MPHSIPVEDLRPWLSLALVPGVSAFSQAALLARFGSPQAALVASHAQRSALIGPRAARALEHGPSEELLERVLQWSAEPNHHLLTRSDARYPQALLHTADPPAVLFAMGRLELLNQPCLAIVGSRNCSPQGRRDAMDFARELSGRGICVVSGLALGIDAAAHEAALRERGSSVALLGTGIDRFYPEDNRVLGQRLAVEGCVLSEYPLGTPPLPGNFPRRNRLISGISSGVLVVEAGIRSGTLGTARQALEQNREVFAIPGSIHAPLSKGCHHLIRQGAKLVEHAEDILVELGWLAPPSACETPEDHPILAAMGHRALAIDQVAQLAGIDAAQAAVQLTLLEVEGRVAALAGGLYQRVA